MSVLTQYSAILQRHLFKRLGSICFASTNAKVDKKVLSELRKRTGYPFSNCLKALQLYPDNIAQAEDWLHEKASEEGWAKAEKLKGRLANQGLIGSVISNNIAAIVEVNCETDFVARNELFQTFVKSVALAAQAFRIRVYQLTLRLQGNSGSDVAHLREVIPVHKLQGLKQGDATEFIQDKLVSVVGKVGEKVTLKPAITIATSTKNRMFSYGHGPVSGNADDFSYGSYLSLVTLKQLEGRYDLEIDTFGSGLAKHITGMGPERISPQNKEDDKALLSQPYLLDSSKTVREHCDRHGIEVVDFIRLQCGEYVTKL